MVLFYEEPVFFKAEISGSERNNGIMLLVRFIFCDKKLDLIEKNAL